MSEQTVPTLQVPVEDVRLLLKFLTRVNLTGAEALLFAQVVMPLQVAIMRADAPARGPEPPMSD